MSLGGAPPYFNTPEDLQEAIQDYFENAPERTFAGKNGPFKAKSLTITGLCYHIGFESRQSFYDYEKRVQFSYTVKRARLFIESEYEAQLTHGNTTGAIFALKNMGWHDKQVVDNLSSDGSMSPSFDESKYKAAQDKLSKDLD